MCDNSKQLRDQATFAQRQAQTGLERARKASTDLAQLDIESAFQKLHKLVDLVGGKSRHAAERAVMQDNVTALPMAAE